MSTEAIQLVVTDLDGTLWDHHQQIHATTFDALFELQQAAVPVLVATGRRRRSAQSGLAHNGLVFPCVLLNGSLGVDLEADVVFHQRSFHPDEALAVLERYEQHGLGPCAYTAAQTPDVLVGSLVSTTERHQAHLTPFWERVDLRDAAASTPILGFSSLGHKHRGPLDALALDIAVEIGTTVVAYDPAYEGYSLMVQPAGISKWDGVLSFCRTIGIDPCAVLALGDAENDLDLLANAAVGIAMGGANAVVLEAADVEVAPTADGGWADAIRRFVLNEDAGWHR